MSKQVIIKTGVNSKDAFTALKEVKKSKADTGKTSNGINFKKILNTIILF